MESRLIPSEKIRELKKAPEMYENRPDDCSNESYPEYWICWIGATVVYEFRSGNV